MKNIIERIFAGAGIVALLALFMAAQTSIKNVTVGPNSVLDTPSLSVFYASNNPPLSSITNALSTWPGSTNVTSLGAVTNGTYKGLTITTTTGTFTLANSKTFTVNNTLTLSGTDSSTLNIGGGGTLGGQESHLVVDLKDRLHLVRIQGHSYTSEALS